MAAREDIHTMQTKLQAVHCPATSGFRALKRTNHLTLKPYAEQAFETKSFHKDLGHC